MAAEGGCRSRSAVLVRIKVDEDLPRAAVILLRQAGFDDTKSVVEQGMGAGTRGSAAQPGMPPAVVAIAPCPVNEQRWREQAAGAGGAFGDAGRQSAPVGHSDVRG